MTARLPRAYPLVGRVVALEPLTGDDAAWAGLYPALAHPEVFAGGWGGGVAALTRQEAAFTAWLRDYVQGAPYLVRLRAGHRAVGITSLYNYDPSGESIMVGYTAYAPDTWGTAVNPEAKLLLLSHVFGYGIGRVELRADELNARSRAAILKLGATFEGISRRDRQRADGSWRNAAVFSLLADEWPAARAALVARLAALAG